jgi:prepilin-type N-terminal cleavage/methylation domain-containing protein
MKGFTLVEMMVVVAISALIVAALYALHAQGTFSWYTTDASVEVTQDARRAMDIMTRELANTADRACDITTTLAPNDAIAFHLPVIDEGTGNITSWGNEITYFRGGSGNSQLLRSQDLTETVLCNNLETDDIDGNGVTGIEFHKDTTTTGTAINITLETRKTSVKRNILYANITGGVELRNR